MTSFIQRVELTSDYLRYPIAGPIGMEYSAFSVDGRPDLGMLIYNPSTQEDAQRIFLLIST